MSALVVHDLEIGQKGHALTEPFSFTHPTHETLAILGPNGVGKTTFLKTLLGMVPALSGSVSWSTLGAPRTQAFWERVSYVPQAKSVGFTAPDVLTAVLMGRNARFEAWGEPTLEDTERALHALARVGLASLSHRPVHALSGGEYQLVLTARALINAPQCWVLDEPESNLDFKNQTRLLTLIREEQARGCGALFNTHLPTQALQVADKVLLFFQEPQGPARVVYGETHSLLTSETLSTLYGTEVLVGNLAGEPAMVVR